MKNRLTTAKGLEMMIKKYKKIGYFNIGVDFLEDAIECIKQDVRKKGWKEGYDAYAELLGFSGFINESKEENGVLTTVWVSVKSTREIDMRKYKRRAKSELSTLLNKTKNEKITRLL